MRIGRVKINVGIFIRNVIIFYLMTSLIFAILKVDKLRDELLERENEPEVITAMHKVNKGEFEVTAYCACSKCCGKWADGYTASGTKATAGRTIAADTSILSFGTEVKIEGLGNYIVEDVCGAIKGNKLDIFFNSHEEALEFGVKNLIVEWVA